MTQRIELSIEPWMALREGGAVPFGPFLSLAGLVAMMFGAQLLKLFHL